MLVQFSIIEMDVDSFSETSADFSDSFGSVISDLYEFESVKAQVLGTKNSGDEEIRYEFFQLYCLGLLLSNSNLTTRFISSIHFFQTAVCLF